jgi:phosphatidylserine/phosphatidylglycerophosphate/cardiolipin synthase-like enzyme
VLRTYAQKRPPFPFAPNGERSIARAYAKAFARARSLIYIEDQYLWSAEVASGIADALRANPGLHVIVVLPPYPDADGAVTGPPSRLGQLRAVSVLRRAAPDRVGVFDLENAAGTPIYVHAKVCIIDDTWMTCGSDNFNLRSWTTDSELTCAIVAGDTARDLRRELWAEHLGLDRDDPRLLDTGSGLALWKASSDALDAWHRSGKQSARPSGQARRHHIEPVSRLQRVWAQPLSRLLLDPDSRPRRLRRTAEF